MGGLAARSAVRGCRGAARRPLARRADVGAVAEGGVQPVVADAAMQGVGSLVEGGQPVVAPATEQAAGSGGVGEVGRQDHVGPWPARHRFVVVDERIGSRAAADEAVVPRAAVDVVAAGVAINAVAACPADYLVVVRPTAHHVLAGLREAALAADRAGADVVVPGTAELRVGAWATRDREVAARTASEPVVALAAARPVVAAAQA